MSGILHIHSMYSINDSTQTPEDIVLKAKEIGINNITLTDHGTLMGIENFMAAGKKHNVNSIPGVETYIKERRHLILIAKNYKGYQDICHAMKEANNNIYEKKISPNKVLAYPIMQDITIKKYFSNNPDVIATTACIKGCVCDILLEDYKVKKGLKKYENACDELYEGYIGYQKLKDEIKEMKEILKNEKALLRKYKKSLSKETSDKIEKLKVVMDTQKPETKKYQNAVNKLNILEEDIATANNELQNCETKVNDWTKKIEESSKVLKELKKQHDSYKKNQDRINEVKYKGEDALYEEAKKELLWYKSIFENLYIELQYHGMDEEKYVMPIMVKLAHECNVPLIAANDAHVTNNKEDDFEARRIVRYNYFDKAQNISPYDRELYIKDTEQLRKKISEIIKDDDVDKAIKNLCILDECKVVFPNEEHHPSVNIEESFDELIEQERQVRIKKGEWDEEHEERLRHEINIIKKMGYIDYHLVVRDFCIVGRKFGVIPQNMIALAPDYDFDILQKWIEDNGFKIGVGIGPGRGSAVGSLVCNMLKITKLDPLKYGLLFERFLNPERVSMPDIDTDVASAIRPLVIKYLKWEYGENAVCSIGTEMTYGARNAVLAAGRDRASQLYGDTKEGKEKQGEYRKKYTEKITDLISEEIGIKLSDCDEIFENELDMNETEYQKIIKNAKLIEGKLSGTGCHAGGVVISDNDNINDYLPIAWNTKQNVWYAQCDMIQVEEKGLLKMDILGLNTLDCITECLQLIYRYENKVIDIDAIPFEKEVFEHIYSKGLTNEVFQFESDGMKNMLKDFKPTCFEDIILLVAAYRPGPMQYLEDIIKIKNGKKKIEYKTPELESILAPTYGAVIYQEQVMMIFQKLAGYSLGGADLVRRAMSKKKLDKLAHEQEAFINGDPERGIVGCVANGISEKVATALFDEMMEFAKYAFNKSHAAAYATVSYQTAWLKYHYPQYFLCAMFNKLDQKKYKVIIDDCNKMNINIKPLSINDSYYDFVIENGSIRYGLRGIKGLGDVNKGDIEQICYERKNKLYRDIKDFLKRNIIVKKNKDGIKYTTYTDSIMHLLINTGCFDEMHPNRAALIRDYSLKADKREDLEKLIDTLYYNDEPQDINYNMAKEIVYLDSIISIKPLEEYNDDAYYNCTPISEIRDDGTYEIFGLVVDSLDRKSKKGNDLIIIKIQGKDGECSAIAMNQLYNAYNQEALLNKVVKLKISHSDKGNFINEIYLMDSAQSTCYIDLDTENKTLKFAELMNNRKDENRTINAVILCRYIGKEKLTYTSKPKIVNRMLSDREVELAKKYKIM